MSVSVRMDPLLEKQLEQAAKRQGITKSQFIIDAVERSLGRKNPFEMMNALKAEEGSPQFRKVAKAYQGWEQAYETDISRAALTTGLRAKHASSAD
jgi:predicted DNA-binding protein